MYYVMGLSTCGQSPRRPRGLQRLTFTTQPAADNLKTSIRVGGSETHYRNLLDNIPTSYNSRIILLLIAGIRQPHE